MRCGKGRLPALHAQGDPRAARRAGADRVRPDRCPTRATSSFEDGELGLDEYAARGSSAFRSSPAARRSTPAGSRRYLIERLAQACRSTWTSRPSSATATLAAGRRDPGAGHLPVGRDRRHAGRHAPRDASSARARRRSATSIGSTHGARVGPAWILTHAGPEIGVASTKAFLAQVVASYMLAVRMGRARGRIDLEQGQRELARRPASACARRWSESCSGREAVTEPRRDDRARAPQGREGLPLPRSGDQLPGRARGRAEAQGDLVRPRRGLPGGRDEARPDRADRARSCSIVVVNSAEGRARRRQGALEHRAGEGARRSSSSASVRTRRATRARGRGRFPVPDVERVPSRRFSTSIPLQLFAYHHRADARGCDIDKPRNLAKSVTVE